MIYCYLDITLQIFFFFDLPLSPPLSFFLSPPDERHNDELLFGRTEFQETDAVGVLSQVITASYTNIQIQRVVIRSAILCTRPSEQVSMSCSDAPAGDRIFLINNYRAITNEFHPELYPVPPTLINVDLTGVDADTEDPKVVESRSPAQAFSFTALPILGRRLLFLEVQAQVEYLEKVGTALEYRMMYSSSQMSFQVTPKSENSDLSGDDIKNWFSSDWIGLFLQIFGVLSLWVCVTACFCFGRRKIADYRWDKERRNQVEAELNKYADDIDSSATYSPARRVAY